MNANSRIPDIATFIQAAKAPRHLFPWMSNDRNRNAIVLNGDAFLLDSTPNIATLHLMDHDQGYGGYTIMDDSDKEIRRHMAAILAAKGRVLKTGLGFGCFVRACLLKPEVEHIDVVEIDPEIIAHFGAEFAGNPRVTIHHADAFEFPVDGKHWDLAWHDIYCQGNDGLQGLHVKLIKRYRKHCDRQGAWKLPRWVGRLARRQFVGSPKIKRRKK
jgi:hypothetical protein